MIIRRFYGADVFDENEYDQCPIEFESCLQSLFSSRRNTVPFASPVTFLDENGELLNLPDSESSLKSSAPIIRSKINSVIDQHERPSCTPFIKGEYNNFEENRRSLLQDSSEYHRGNSIRLRTMPMPLRANIITTKPFVHNIITDENNDSSKGPFVQNIKIGTPIGTITRNPENNTIVQPVVNNNEISNLSSLSQISEDKEIHNFSETVEEEEEDFYTITLAENTLPKSLKNSDEKDPPPKPPRGRYVAKPITCIDINNKVKQGPVKRLSINTASFETFFFNKNDKINIKGANKDSNIPKKSILKNGFKSKFQLSDPNEALFGPVEHIYETIDSDPSTISSDDDRSSVPESHPRPVSFASSTTTNTVISEQKPKHMTFCPRSLHAYHRQPLLETGQIQNYEENIINPSFPLDMEPSYKESIKFGSVAKKIARMPSILSKAM
uniref:Uncharacterized protein n=1 Tax=Panagrolaimus davidi TaxID=227884 RepID=A0A914Q7I8_9BILA